MLQKQRDMFNPEMSTKNILNKLKRSADSQSPRRLSGPMKGYDIRSNSSISSLVDSDKSQLDRSQVDAKLNLSDVAAASQRNEDACSRLELDSSQKLVSCIHFGRLVLILYYRPGNMNFAWIFNPMVCTIRLFQ